MNNTWYVIGDGGNYNQADYRGIYSFSSDSMKINFLGANGIAKKIRLITESTIEIDSFPLIHYKFDHDTLFLRYARSTFDTINLTLLPFIPKKSNLSEKELDRILLSNNWSYTYENINFNATFLNKYFSPNIRYAEIQVYYDNNFDRSLQLPLWKIEEVDDQLILIIESHIDPYANVFYINGITTNNDIKTTTWQSSNKYEVIFKKQFLIDSAELLEKRNKLIASWKIKSAHKAEQKLIDPEDTTYIILEPIPIFGKINKNTVIEESDFENGSILYQFLADGTFQLLKNKNEVCRGKWELNRNGELVTILSNSGFLIEEFQTECNDFLIKRVTDEILQIEQWIPIYESDSTVPEKYYRLTMEKNYAQQ